MKYIIIFTICAFIIVFWKEVSKVVLKCVNIVAKSVKDFVSILKIYIEKIGRFDIQNIMTDMITKAKKLNLFGMSTLLSWFFIGCIVCVAIGNDIELSGIFSTYKEFTAEELSKMKCEDLFMKNNGKMRKFVGKFSAKFHQRCYSSWSSNHPHYARWITTCSGFVNDSRLMCINKSDLYNSRTKYFGDYNTFTNKIPETSCCLYVADNANVRALRNKYGEKNELGKSKDFDAVISIKGKIKQNKEDDGEVYYYIDNFKFIKFKDEDFLRGK